MALSDTAKLVVDLSLAGNFSRSITQAGRSLNKFDAQVSNTSTRAFKAGQQIGTGIKRGVAIGVAGIGLLGFEVKQGLDSLVQLEAQTDATNAAIKSTGGVAGITAAQVRKMAEDFESVNALFGDELIQSAENMLLAFTNVRKRAFKPALQAALDLSAGMGKGPDGLVAATKTLGIALNDPVKGLGRLSKAGVTFTAAQVKRIKALVKENRLYDAQAIILKEVEKRFGGRAAAFGGDVAKKVAKFNDAIEDTQRNLAAGFLPVVSNVADALDELFRDPEVQKGISEFGKNLAAVFTKDNIKSGIATIKDVFSTIASVAGPAASAVGAMVDAFQKIPPDLRNILIGAFAVNKVTGGLITNILGGLKDLVVGSMNVQAANVTVVGAGGGVPGVGAPTTGGGGVGGLLKGALALTVAGAIVAVAPEIGKAFAAALPDSFKGRPGETGMNDPERLLKTARAMQPATQVLGPGIQEHLHEEHIRRGQGTIDQSLKDSQKRLETQQAETKRETTRGVEATNATKNKVGTTGTAIQNTTRASSLSNAAIISSSIGAQTGALVAAIYGARPVVNVTNVTSTINKTVRYGATSGSRGSNTGSDSNLPP